MKTKNKKVRGGLTPGKLPEGKNTGLLFARPFDTDWRVGGETGITYDVRLTNGDWTPYLPTPEAQFRRSYYDTMSCVTFAALNIVEMQMNYLIATGKITGSLLDELKARGYIDSNGKFNANDNFSAIMNGTTKDGNYLQAAWDSFRRDGILPQGDFTSPEDMANIEEWLDKSRVTEAMKTKAKWITTVFDFSYEWVVLGEANAWPKFEKHLKQAPLHVATPVCPTWNTGTVAVCDDRNLVHATSIYGLNQGVSYKDLDHYNPYEKTLDWNYYVPYAVKGLVEVKVQAPPPSTTTDFTYTFTQSMKFGDRGPEVAALQKFLLSIGLLRTSTGKAYKPTGLYWYATKTSVTKFQERYAKEILEPLGLKYGTGEVSVMTLKKLNELCSPANRKGKKLIDALIQVESGGDDYAIGDLHLTQKAYGCLQIRQPVITDVNKKFGTKYTAKGMLGNRAASIDVFNKYMSIYATAERLGHEPSNEEMARIWNGGPTGHTRPTTVAYWQKVVKYL